MRKHLVWVMGLAAVVALASVGTAAAFTTTQLINGKVTPTNRPKAKRVPATLFVDVSATTDNPNGIPSPAKLGKVDFDKDGAFYQTGLATCDPSQFKSTTTTQQAKSACGASQIGTGSAKILIPTGPSTPPLNVPAVITVFNGKQKTIVLHTYNTVSGAQTLVGTLGPSTGGSKYGNTLTVPIPPLAGGIATIQEFNATIHKTFHFKGKKRSLFSAKCGADKKFNFQARFTFNDGTSSTGTAAPKCKQKG